MPHLHNVENSVVLDFSVSTLCNCQGEGPGSSTVHFKMLLILDTKSSKNFNFTVFIICGIECSYLFSSILGFKFSRQIYYITIWTSEAENGFPWAKTRVTAWLLSFWGLKRRICFLFLSSFSAWPIVSDL